MPIPDSDILTDEGLKAIAAALEKDKDIHKWEVERVLFHFAYSVDPRLWFLQSHIFDLCHLLGIQQGPVLNAFLNLQGRVLIPEFPVTRPRTCLSGKTIENTFCYRMERSERERYSAGLANLRQQTDQAALPTQPTITEVLPMSVVEKTRPYVERVILEANGCYENGWFNACAVMIRRFVETLIIEVYDKAGKADDIKGRDGNFLMLSGLVDHVLADSSLHLGRETKRGLPLIKSLGDRSAHNRYFIAKKEDIDKVVPDLRVVADEFLSLADLKRP
jgi:hypothetical protein